MMRGHAHPDEASHGEAGKVAWSGAERPDEHGGVVRQSRHIVAAARVLRLALGTMVISNDAIIFLKGGALRLEHGVVHKQAMGEDNGLRAGA
jgi:hypothetical protein